MFRGFTSVSLSMADLKLCTQRSARLLLAGWYGADVRRLIPFLLRNIWNSSDINYGPLSLTYWDGTPYLENKLCSFSMVFVEIVVSIFSISNHLEWASTTSIASLSICTYLCSVFARVPEAKAMGRLVPSFITWDSTAPIFTGDASQASLSGRLGS